MKTAKNLLLGQTVIQACDMAEANDRFSLLTENDWLQIEQAANGCIGGNSDEWPALRHAISLITGKPFGDRKPASWLQGFCEGVLIQSGRQ